MWHREGRWPKRPDALGEIPSDGIEVKKEVITCASVNGGVNSPIDPILEWFSSWNRLKKFVAWMLRYQRNLREAYSSRKKNELRNCSGQNIKPITVDEMRIAEREVLKYVHRRIK